MNNRNTPTIPTVCFTWFAAIYLVVVCLTIGCKKQEKNHCIVSVWSGTDIQWLPMPDGSLMPVTYNTYDTYDTCNKK